VKILLLGNTGQLGYELQRSLQSVGTVVALDYPQIDMASGDDIRWTIQAHQPQVIINATAYTAVDKAESEPELAAAINAFGPGVLALEASQRKIFLVHYSTDYVFDGNKGTPYLESDLPNPMNVYGRSKLEGEQTIQQVGGDYLILRTSWVYSLHQQSGFVNKVLQWSRQKETLSIVNDQIANPTWARSLAEVTAQLLTHGEEYIRQHQGLYHLAGSGFTSRFEWARRILELDPNQEEQACKQLLPGLTADFPTPACRPLFSALDCSLFKDTFGFELPSWEESLRRALQ
jgi:dTDP-4-dehydrorhamnose reductase